MGDNEVLYDASTALAHARRLIPEFEGELMPRCRHDMCFSQHRFVDARVLEFLKRANAEREDYPPGRVVAERPLKHNLLETAAFGPPFLFGLHV